MVKDESWGFSESDLVASICREDFYSFVQEFWPVVIPEKPVWNWHIRYLCRQIQLVAERVFAGLPKLHDLIVNIPPGSTKSTIASVMFPAWVWTRDPTMRCICGSYAYPLAMDLSRKCRDIVLSEKYMAAFPDVILREDQNTKGYFANTKGGMRYAVGVGGSVTGMHGHFIIIDDPLDPQQAVSEAELKTANDWMNETLPSRKVDKKITPTILIMQRLHQNDPSGNRLEKAKQNDSWKVKHVCLPADMYEYEVKPKFLRRYYQDGLLDPVRMSRNVLREAYAQLGEYGYSGQFGQSPVPRGGGMFKVDLIQIENPPLNKIIKRVRYWDKAGTHDDGAYTVGVLMGAEPLNSKDPLNQYRYWVLDVIRGQWDSFKRETIIRNTAEQDGKEVVIGLEQEPGSGGKESAQATVRRLAGFRVKVDRPTGSKEDRADPFSAQVNAGNVLLKPAQWNLTYLDELRYFPNSTYKDQVDASSGAFNMLASVRRRVGAL